MDDLTIMVKLLENAGFLIKGVSEASKIKLKEQQGGFFSMLLGTLGTILLRNNFAIKGVVRGGHGVNMSRWRNK